MKKLALCLMLVSCLCLGQNYFFDLIRMQGNQAQTCNPVDYTDLIPIMSSDTTPSGVASAIAEPDADNKAWRAMVRFTDPAHAWFGGLPAVYPAWIQYEFTAPKIAHQWIFDINNFDSEQVDIKLEGSNDGFSTSTLISETNGILSSIGDIVTNNFVNNTAYLQYRMTIISRDNNTAESVVKNFLLMGCP